MFMIIIINNFEKEFSVIYIYLNFIYFNWLLSLFYWFNEK